MVSETLRVWVMKVEEIGGKERVKKMIKTG